jgi:hypothetical protein
MKWAAVLCLGTLPVQATTLVALWTPDRIVLGADSRVITDVGSSQACKIGLSGDVWMAASGLVAEARSGYLVGPIARRALGDSGPLQGRVERFVEAVQQPLAQAVAALRVDAPADYAQLRSGRPVLQAIFAVRENGRPVLATVALVMNSAGELEPRGSYIDGSDARGPRLIYAGQQERIRAYIKTHPAWIDDEAHDLVRKLVQVEIDAGSPFVGGPVDVISIDHAGARWIELKSACTSK